MNKFYTALFLLIGTWSNAQKQDISIQNLVEYTFMQKESFEHNVQNKSFKNITAESATVSVYERRYKNNMQKHVLQRQQVGDTVSVTYQTTSNKEFAKWRQELQDNGFAYYKDRDKKEEDLYPVFQKRNVIARLSLQYDEEQTLYSLKLDKIHLPDVSEIRFAEDLLKLNAHEYIAAVFGPSNVKQDVFYFSEQEVNQCSILFPNSSNQVIFIWKDEVNKRGISFLLLGGQINTRGGAAIYSGNVFHKWRSKQGVYLGMTLKELQQLNNEIIEFYGWETEQPGYVKKNDKGAIDFGKLGLQLQCYDCSDDFSQTNALLNSKNVLKTSDRIFVSSMIVMPEKR